MAGETGEKKIEYVAGMDVRHGQFYGKLTWVDPGMAVDKDNKPTGKKTGDCNFVHLVQVGKGTPASYGFDGLYFQIKAFKTNVSQLSSV